MGSDYFFIMKYHEDLPLVKEPLIKCGDYDKRVGFLPCKEEKRRNSDAIARKSDAAERKRYRSRNISNESAVP